MESGIHISQPLNAALCAPTRNPQCSTRPGRACSLSRHCHQLPRCVVAEGGTLPKAPTPLNPNTPQTIQSQKPIPFPNFPAPSASLWHGNHLSYPAITCFLVAAVRAGGLSLEGQDLQVEGFSISVLSSCTSSDGKLHLVMRWR